MANDLLRFNNIKKQRYSFDSGKTVLAFTSILGLFGVHLLEFTLDTHPGSLMHYSGLLEFTVRICDA